ncbi:hypothetical protein GGI42DRAFT_333156 [Trichoderma sp. SZMC 28013]
MAVEALPARALRMPGLVSMVLDNTLPPWSQTQSLRYSCVSVSGCFSFLSLVINTTHHTFYFSIRFFCFLFLGRRVEGQLLGKSMRLACKWKGQSVGAVNRPFIVLMEQGCPRSSP